MATDGLKVGNPSPILLTLQEGAFHVRHFELAGTNTYLVVTGGGTLRQGPDLKVRGALGLGLVPLFARFLTRAAGRADFRLRLQGPWDGPRMAGTATLTADTLRFAGFSQDVHTLTCELDFNPQKVSVTKIRGEIGGGTFSGQGTVEMATFLPRRFALDFDVDHVRYNVSKNLWGVATGVLGIKGEPGELVRLSGELRLQEGGFDEHIRLVTLDGGLLRRRVRKARTYAKEREAVAFDIRLQIPQKFKVRYNLDLIDFKAEMQGDLRVTGTNERLGLLGEMEALEGTVTYISRDFALDSARVQFVDKTSVHPRVDVFASLSETVDRGSELDFGKRGGKVDYRITLQLTADGDKKPEISLKSEPFEEERDIIMLLHFGWATRDLQTLKGQDLAGLGGDILFRSLKLDKRLSRMFPFPPEVIQTKYLRVRSRLSPGQTGIKSASTSPHVEAGLKLRFISDNLDLEYSGSLYDQDIQSVDLTYNLSQTVSTRLRWENEGLQDSVGDFGDLGLDLRLQWEW
jgi:translocation and assembly module TamB